MNVITQDLFLFITWSYSSLNNNKLSLHPRWLLKPACHSLKNATHSLTSLRSNIVDMIL